MKEKAIIGCLLGTAVGDAMGLPCEGLSPGRIRRLFQATSEYHFLFGRGMVSDDTEHLCMTAQAWMTAKGDVDLFRTDLAKRLRYWLLALPAGVGFATLRSILKLWLGFSPCRSGVISAGNGPAMRSTLLGVELGDRPEILKQFVHASTAITHTDPKAYAGALAVAIAAYENATHSTIDPTRYWERINFFMKKDEHGEFLECIERVIESVRAGESTQEFVHARKLDRGVTGYMLHTVPVVLHVWLSSGNDYPAAISTMIEFGGDTDTTAAILGGIIGSAVGKEGIPEAWIDRLWEWPRTVAWMEKLGKRLSEPSRDDIPHLSFWLVVPRNWLFLLIVLFHGFRRIFPPY